jgi:preprotein translocase subunit YajC
MVKMLLPFLMANPQPGTAQPSSPIAFIFSLLPFALIILVFYFLLIRPQMKKQKEVTNMLKKLEKGDKVLTAGGLIGTVVGVNEDVVTVRFGENFKAEVGKSFITQKITDQVTNG